MLIVAIVSVKNEEMLINHCLRHLFNIGVDSVVVEDYGSTDDTLKHLARWPSCDVTVRHFDESRDLDRVAWGRHEAQLARETKADWVLFLDADEFWLPRDGSIRKWLPLSEGAMIVFERFNAAMHPDSPWNPGILKPEKYPNLHLFTYRSSNFRAELDSDAERPWSIAVPMPKIAVRPTQISQIHPGHHGALDFNGQVIPAKLSQDCVIAHLPFTEFERFKRKVSSIRCSLEQQASYHTGTVAWHWRRWAELEGEEQLKAEFKKQQLDDDEIRRLRNEGVILSVEDLLAPPDIR